MAYYCQNSTILENFRWEYHGLVVYILMILETHGKQLKDRYFTWFIRISGLKIQVAFTKENDHFIGYNRWEYLGENILLLKNGVF